LIGILVGPVFCFFAPDRPTTTRAALGGNCGPFGKDCVPPNCGTKRVDLPKMKKRLALNARTNI
jgi:hypothetical protein